MPRFQLSIVFGPSRGIPESEPSPIGCVTPRDLFPPAAPKNLAVVPGSGFGAAGHVRLSYATSMPNITEGVGRLGRALGTLT